MKPDWNDAPEWANWLAMDEDGEWCWHECFPSSYVDGWGNAGRKSIASRNEVVAWRTSMESRP